MQFSPEMQYSQQQFSPAAKFGGFDGMADTHADILSDQITPYVLAAEDQEDNEDDWLDPWDRHDAQQHRKKTMMHNINAKHRRRLGAPGVPMQEEAPGLARLLFEERLLKNPSQPHGVWTIGDGTQGQGGHAKAQPPDEPYPARVEPPALKGGVRSLHAGPFCTLVVNAAGDVLGFGKGAFRSAAAAPPSKPAPSADAAARFSTAIPLTSWATIPPVWPSTHRTSCVRDVHWCNASVHAPGLARALCARMQSGPSSAAITCFGART